MKAYVTQKPLGLFKGEILPLLTSSALNSWLRPEGWGEAAQIKGQPHPAPIHARRVLLLLSRGPQGLGRRVAAAAGLSILWLQESREPRSTCKTLRVPRGRSFQDAWQGLARVAPLPPSLPVPATGRSGSSFTQHVFPQSQEEAGTHPFP